MKILALTVLVLLPALIIAGLARSVYRSGVFAEIANWWRGASRLMKAASILFASIAICNSDAFCYNRRSEVTNACISGTATAYGYDEIGSSSRYTANRLNQYTDFAYDADGNMLTDGAYSFVYDGAGTGRNLCAFCMNVAFSGVRSARVSQGQDSLARTHCGCVCRLLDPDGVGLEQPVGR